MARTDQRHRGRRRDLRRAGADVTAVRRPRPSAFAHSGRAIIIEEHPHGVWMATAVDASTGRPIKQSKLDRGPVPRATGDAFCVAAGSIESSFEPADAVIFLAD